MDTNMAWNKGLWALNGADVAIQKDLATQNRCNRAVAATTLCQLGISMLQSLANRCTEFAAKSYSTVDSLAQAFQSATHLLESRACDCNT
jgi:hypothetical protein